MGATFSYIREVIVFLSTIDEHIEHVDEFLKRSEIWGYRSIYRSETSSPRRSNAWFTSSDQERWRFMNQWLSVPRSCARPKHWRSYMNVYRRFIPKYTAIALQIYDLQKVFNVKRLLSLTDDHIDAIHALIGKLVSVETLTISKPGLRYSLDTDDSGYPVGCALFQKA